MPRKERQQSSTGIYHVMLRGWANQRPVPPISNKGANFWTGNAKFDLNGAYSCSGCMPSGFKYGESTITGKYVGQFEGVNVFETKELGSFKTPGEDNCYHYRGITIPERGIIAAEGALTGGRNFGKDLLQHEFGHILQYRMVGPHAYWGIIAPESIASSFNDSFHHHFWTETWANYLSKGYFGADWIVRSEYPAKNISLFNWLRLKTRQSIGIMNYRPRGFI